MMITRTIMIFPEFDNIDSIDKIRSKYDPLAELVRPHVTLVFPFESDMTDDEIRSILESRLQDIRPFDLTLQGFSKYIDEKFGNHLFLNITEGYDEVVKIHDILYANEFQRFDLGFPYVPHMTVGKQPTIEAIDRAYEDALSCTEVFSTKVTKISVEMIGEHEESIIIIEKELK